VIHLRLSETCDLSRPEVASVPLPDFLPVWISTAIFTVHAPSGSRCSIFHRTRENVAEAWEFQTPTVALLCSFHESPLSATADPENDRFQAVSKAKKTTLMRFRGASISMAHAWSVKTEISDLSAVERVSNQL